MIEENLKNIQSTIRRISPHATLIAVSKTYSVADIQRAYACGQRHFGENKVQELMSKAPLLPPDIIWHLIGPLQSNKVAKALEYANYIHAVDRVSLIEHLQKRAAQKGKIQNILLEVNITGESTKSGLTPSTVETLMPTLLDASHLKLQGLMTLAEAHASSTRLHETFCALRLLRDTLAQTYALTLPELSMGMSGDYIPALEEGATMVRIGTAIFGCRHYDA